MAVSTLGALVVFALPALGQYVMEHQNSIDWTDANAYCASTYGTTLATIKDDADASTLLAMKQNLGSYRVWIGLNDIETENEWVWASGYECEGECNALKWWNNGEPNDSAGEDCAEIRSGATDIDTMLNDIPCTWTGVHYFLCDAPNPTEQPTAFPSGEPSVSPSEEPTAEPTKDCSKFHIDEFLMDCSVEFDGHGDRIQSLESGGSSMGAVLTEVAQDVSELQQEAIVLANITKTMSVSINSNSDQLTQYGQDISDLKATVNGLVNVTVAMATSANTLSAEVRAIMEHLDILGDYSPASGMTAVGQVPMEMSDYVLYTLVAINLIVMVCLAIYCVCTRVAAAPKYGKVVMYGSEA